MEKNTLLAVVLSVIVISVGFMVQNMLFPPEPPVESVATSEPVQTDTPTPGTDGARETTTTTTVTDTVSRQQIGNPIRPVEEAAIDADRYVYENDTIRVVFDPSGARIVSYQLLEHLDGNEPVEMVLQGETDTAAFELRFGGVDAPPVRDLFRLVDSTDPNTVTWERDFYVQGTPSQPFTVTRTYRFYPGEYVVEVGVEITNSVNSFVPLDFSGAAYTITYGPQIGPSYDTLDGRNEYRNFYYYDGDKRQNVRMRNTVRETLTERVQWAALSGKYFAVIAIP
jgi:YidC/Oxa1 family membrane protein insertase